MVVPGWNVMILTSMFAPIVLIDDIAPGAWFAQVDVKSPTSQHSTVRPVSVLTNAVTWDF